MTLQGLAVALLVTGCTLSAIWTLMPASWRRATAKALLGLRLPDAIARRLRRHAEAASGCGCDGCDRSELKARAPTDAVKPLRFHPRPPR